MNKPNENKRPGTTLEPAPDSFRDSIEAEADRLEDLLSKAEAEADAMTLAGIASLLRETSDHHYQYADSADEDEAAQACRIQSAAIYRAAKIIDELSEKGGAK